MRIGAAGGQDGVVQVQVRGVLFDNDGVLVASDEAVEASWRQVVAEFALDPARVFPLRFGLRGEDLLAEYVADRHAEAVARLEELEILNSARVRPVPGAAALLASLPVGTWAVATSGSRRLATTRLTAAGLPVPAALVAAEDVTRGKPDPEPYLTAAARLGLDPTACAVFEDAPAGVAAGLAAGATVVGVGHRVRATGAHAVVDDLTAVRAEPVAGAISLTIG